MSASTSKKLREFHRNLAKATEIKPTVTDSELSSLLRVPVRTVQRYLASLKSSGLVEVANKRHLHHAYGWCNERTLKITRSY